MQTQSIKSIRKLGVKKTLDFKVNHSDHNFYAEGIVVSNSHSAAYGYLTAITAYFKANHPKEFFLSLLKNAQNESEPLVEVNKIQKELKWFGIKLLPPSLLKGNTEFVIEGNDIRFGLNSIKGLAESALKKLESFKPQDCTKFEMFQASKQAGLSCGVMASLIMSGALDEFVVESRSKLSFECLLFSKLKDKEKLYCINQNKLGRADLIELIRGINDWTDSSGKKISRKTRLNTLRKDTAKYQEIYKNNQENEELTNYWYELENLGYAYSGTLKSIFNKTRTDIINLSEFQNLEKGQHGIIIGIVKESILSVSKRGNKMAKIIISDEHISDFRAYLCGRAFEEYHLSGKLLPKEKDIIAIKIRKIDDKNMGFIEKFSIQSAKIYCKFSDIKEDLKEKEQEILKESVSKPMLFDRLV